MFLELTLGDWLVSMIRSAISAFINGRFEALGLSIHPLISAALTLALLFHGMRVMIGDAVGSMKALLRTAILLVAAIGATMPDIYHDFFYEPLFLVKDRLSSFIMLSTNGTIYEAFSATNERMFAHASNIMDTAGWDDFKLFFVAGSIYIIYGLYYALFVGVTIYCELCLGILMLLGSLIIPISAFESARLLLRSWLIAIIKYLTTFVIIAFIISFLNIISDMLVDALMKEVYTKRELNTEAIGLDSPVFGGTLLIGVFGIYILYQCMEFASELTGGVMSDGSRGVTSITNTATSAVRGYGAANRGLSALRSKKG